LQRDLPILLSAEDPHQILVLSNGAMGTVVGHRVSALDPGGLIRMVRAIALGLTVLTGTLGLVYEVAWQKFLAILLGSQSEATAAILALFLGSLSLGYHLFGKLSRRISRQPEDFARRRLLFLYALAEAGIGIWAWTFLVIFDGVWSISASLPATGAVLGFAIDLILAGCLIVPPAVLMGATIPMLTQALSRDVSNATRLHAWVYGLNTLGAFAGALLAGFWLVPVFGLRWILLVCGAANLARNEANMPHPKRKLSEDYLSVVLKTLL
jgi:predicted membrane-bound spermidine synthase